LLSLCVFRYMKWLSSHISIRVVVLLLVSLSVMGFITVINYCTMSNSSECCCESEHSKTPVSTPSFETPYTSCNIKFVAGGLNPVAQNVISESTIKSVTIDLIPLDAGIYTLPIVPRIPLLVHANDLAPPSVDIYIRNTNLLI